MVEPEVTRPSDSDATSHKEGAELDTSAHRSRARLCGAEVAALPTGRSFLESLRDIVFVLSIFIFFAGFVYDFAFLRDVGIPPAAITIPVNATFAHAYSVLVDHWIYAILFIISAILIVLLPTVLKTVDPQTVQVGSRASAVVLAAIALPVLYAMAEDSAQRRVDELRQRKSQLPTSFVVLCKAQRKGYPVGFIDAAREGSVTVLTESTDNLYVFYQPDIGDSQEHVAHVYAVKKKDIQFSAAILSGGSPVYSTDLTPTNC